MPYDNTKLEKAMKSWLRARTRADHGSVYARAMLDDFVTFAREKKLLKGSPGPVAFGKSLAQLRPKLEKKVVHGMTHWCGIRLIEGSEGAEDLLPASSLKAMSKEEAERVTRAELERQRFNETEEAREERKRRVLEETKRENRERVESARADT